MRPKGVDDGQQVNIPALCIKGYNCGGDAEATVGSRLVVAIVPVLLSVGKSADTKQYGTARADLRCLSNPKFRQEKPQTGQWCITVLKLTQVGKENILRRSREPFLRN